MKTHSLTTKIFWNGGSQAVRLPKDCRFKVNEVRIYKEGERVILEPREKRKWPSGYWEQIEQFAASHDAVIGSVELLDPVLLDLSKEEL